MAVRKQLQRDHAELLIVKEGLSQKEAAVRVGVTEKTMSRWVREGKLDEKRRSFAATRNSIIANLQEQLELLQGEIKKKRKRHGYHQGDRHVGQIGYSY